MQANEEPQKEESITVLPAAPELEQRADEIEPAVADAISGGGIGRSTGGD
jgi:hypothetical protein